MTMKKARVGTIKPMTLFTDLKGTSHRWTGKLGGSSHIGKGESSSQSLPLSSALLKGDVQMKMIGPFNASAPILDDPDIAPLVEFIFDPVVPDERLVETDFDFLNRDLIRSLGPGVECCFQGEHAYSSTSVSRRWKSLVSGISIDSLFPDNGHDDSTRKFYFGDLKKCLHIFIPINNEKIEH
ncbi:uncharacterized protein LOC133818541 [Humulus lupulus]|uniref:uncharacterized protein LOC133818541 n=1 Tax=Humulus lupulus TaxID=3486 RepID=UPI002B41465D|nr:uncharacterized protein LOC133818541 [Humulus lupulus]